MSYHAYRSIQINGEEARRLRDLEVRLRRLAEVFGAGSDISVFADDLATIARRYERTDELESLCDEILCPKPVFVSVDGAASLGATMAHARSAWETAGRPGDRPQLRLVNRAGGGFQCVVCEDRGCEHCAQVPA